MKKIKERKFYIAFFCAIAIALFSLENKMQLEQGDLILEEVSHPITRQSLAGEKASSTPMEENNPSESTSQNLLLTPSKDVIDNTLSNVNEEKKEDTKSLATSSNIEKSLISEPIKEKKDGKEESEETEFSSIQSNGLTLANGNSWYFEEYDENGNIISTVSYNKKRLILKSQFEYNEDGKKISATLTEPKKIIKLNFDDKGFQIGRTEYKKRKGEVGDIFSVYENVYTEDGLLQEEKTTENGITTRKVYTYFDKKIVSETIFENDVKTLFIEYKEDIKIVHIFDEGVELSVFEEALE